MFFARSIALSLAAIQLVGSAAALSFSSTCKKMCVRKEVHDLTDAEWKLFADTLSKFNEKNIQDVSKYDEFVREHGAFMKKDAHGGALFLPWHRAYLHELEYNLQQINPDFCLPYLDWSRIYDNVGSSYIWTKLGRCSTIDTCITGGLFQNFGIKYSDIRISHPTQSGQYCITRGFINTVDDMPSPEMIAKIMGDSRFNYEKFADSWEGFHGYFHVNIGGEMNTGVSPSDPLFILHHGFIDKIWSDYQTYQVSQGGGKQLMFGGYLRDGITKCDLETVLQPFNIKVKNVMDVSDVCVQYARPGEYKSPNLSTTASSTPTAIATSTRVGSQHSATNALPSSTGTATTSSVRPTSQTVDDKYHDSLDKDNKYKKQDTYDRNSYLPKDYKLPRKPLKPLPYNWIQMNYKIDNSTVTAENYLEKLPETVKKVATCGQTVSEYVVDKVNKGEKVELPPMPSYDENRPYTGYNPLKLTNAGKKTMISVGLLLIALPLLF